MPGLEVCQQLSLNSRQIPWSSFVKPLAKMINVIKGLTTTRPTTSPADDGLPTMRPSPVGDEKGTRP